MASCPVAAKFDRLVNMTSAEIRAWARDPRAKCASFKETRDRLTKRQMWKGKMRLSLAELKAKPRNRWDESDCEYAGRVVNFNTRHLGALKQHGCTDREIISLLNWGHRPKACALPTKVCKKPHTPRS